MRFIIDAKLPSLNEYINACRSNRYSGVNFKEKIEDLIGCYIHGAVKRKELSYTSKRLFVDFIWHEKNKRRDADNIASAKKDILDSLQKYNIIPNDNRKTL